MEEKEVLHGRRFEVMSDTIPERKVADKLRSGYRMDG